MYASQFKRVLLFASVFCALGPERVRAEECVRIEAIPQKASLVVHSSTITTSRSPMSYCQVVPGKEYFLNLSSPGYENRTMRFSLSGNGNELVVKGNRGPYVLRSAIIPGTGIGARGHPVRGVWILALNALGGYNMVRAYSDYDEARDTASQLRVAASVAQSVPEAERLAFEATAAALERDSQRDFFAGSAALAGWLYVGNLVETFLLASPPSVKSVEGASAVVETPMMTSKRAFWRSLFFPGLGQSYLGNNVRSFFLQSTFLYGAYSTLDARLEYDQATNNVELAALRFANAQTPAERQAAADAVATASNNQRDKETRRDVFYIVTGAIWFLNVVDAAFSKTPMEKGSVRFQTSYNRSTVWTGLSITF